MTERRIRIDTVRDKRKNGVQREMATWDDSWPERWPTTTLEFTPAPPFSAPMAPSLCN